MSRGKLEGEQQYLSCCGKYYCAFCDYHTGNMVKTAEDLLSYVENHNSLPLIAAGTDTNFDAFVKGLQWLALHKEPCKGCRFGGGWSWNPDCEIRICTMEKGVDFCYQCEEFPCKTLQTEPFFERKKGIIDANTQIKAIGIKKYMQTLKKKYTKVK